MESTLEDVLGFEMVERAKKDPTVASLDACGALLTRPLPVARHAMLALAEHGLATTAVGVHARRLLEDTLDLAIHESHELGATGMLALEIDPDVAELAMPGMAHRAAVALQRVIELVAAIVALAPFHEGLTQRMSARAATVPAYVGPSYVVAFLAALGTAARGPHIDEVRARLEDAAGDPVEAVSAHATGALGEHARNEPRLHALLVEALDDPDEELRVAAAFALADAGGVTDEIAKELADMVEVGDPEEALAAARTLVKHGRDIPALPDEPLLDAAVRVLIAPSDENFLALVIENASTELDEELDERVTPRTILVEAFRAMEPARQAAWLERFASGELAVLGDVILGAVDAEHPTSLSVEPVVAALATAEDDAATLYAIVAARLAPQDARLEAMILERTAGPVTLAALASLARLVLSEDLLLAALEQPELEGLANDALAKADFDVAALVPRLVAHLSDDDPQCESAHATLVAWVERGLVGGAVLAGS